MGFGMKRLQLCHHNGGTKKEALSEYPRLVSVRVRNRLRAPASNLSQAGFQG